MVVCVKLRTFMHKKMNFFILHVDDMCRSVLIVVNICLVEVLMELCGVLPINTLNM